MAATGIPLFFVTYIINLWMFMACVKVASFHLPQLINPTSEAYRLLVGKLGADTDIGTDKDPLLGDHEHGSSSTRNCSCCNESFISRSHAQNLLLNMSIVSKVAELDKPLSVATEHHWNDLKKSRNESSGSLKAYHEEENGFDPLAHIEYARVKITSDTESEVPFSDDDDGCSLIRETVDLKEEISVQCVQMETRVRSLTDDFTSEKLIHPDSAPELPLLDSQVQLDVLGSHSNTSAASTAAIGNGLEELNWSVVEDKVDNSAPSRFASVDEVPQSSDVMDTAVDELPMRLDALGTGEAEQKCVTESEAESRPITKSERISETNPDISDNNLQMHNNLDLGDAYKLAVSSKGRQLSGKFSEQRSLKDSARVSEDLKLLLLQISSARGIELPILQRRISLERNESGLSLDGSIVSEIEGENEIDRLKRQVDHDKKLMGALYKELEEERNASAVATNQAMAMITRLQEEKAALNMEALQCLRMMEEQAEYDVEALQKANDLIAEKEKELQDLEVELELYRNKIEDASTLENKVDLTCDLKAAGVRSENLDADDGVCLEMDNGEYVGRKGDRVSGLKELNCNGKEENVSSMQKHVSAYEESPCAEEGCFPFISEQLISKLEALETDHYSHSCTSVRTGNDHSGEISSPVGTTQDCD
ncbi:myosin-binding protein [Actinidia rufa]|uniref:Myosin-binding protein n=1 Tax=Actinidia rufa TaxID=165716 RepID=A0A7J0F7T7_9ERIC|nr:myosin-binding protein [Actinidia rufa]